jgi:hypothetical protein
VTVTDFVRQRREVFLAQLAIDRKHNEEQRLADQILLEEKKLQDIEAAISETSNQFTMTRAQGEGALTRVNKASDAALKKRCELQGIFQGASESNLVLRAEIGKKRQKLDTYRSYQQFLQRMTPAGETKESFFNSAEVLIGEMDHLEQRNLFLIQNYETLSVQNEGPITRTSMALGLTEEELRIIEAKRKGVPVIEKKRYRLWPGDISKSTAIENELQQLKIWITRTYVRCIDMEPTDSSLLMLERIEMAIDRLYERIHEVNPVHLQNKQRRQDEIRFEQHRLEVQAKKEADQKQKYAQAVARAKMPIKKRTGRPPMRRMLPITLHRKDPEQSRAELEEKERLDELLYGKLDIENGS